MTLILKTKKFLLLDDNDLTMFPNSATPPDITVDKFKQSDY